METSVVHFAERYPVWLVALLASGEAMAGATPGFLDGRLDPVLLWTLTSAGMLLAAFLVPTVKIRRRR